MNRIWGSNLVKETGIKKKKQWKRTWGGRRIRTGIIKNCLLVIH
jgi:hypothetical protein